MYAITGCSAKVSLEARRVLYGWVLGRHIYERMGMFNFHTKF